MKQQLTAGRFANDIRLKRRYPGRDLQSFMLVEGSTDERVYKRFLDKERCQIVIAHNKDNVLNTLAILENERFLGILAIADSDFMFLEGKLPSSHNLLLTDVHDLDLMFVQSPALEKVLTEFGSIEKTATLTEKWGIDVRSRLLACALPIGYLRWISWHEHLALKFEDMKFDKFIDREKLTVDTRLLIRYVQSNTAQNAGSPKSRLKDEDIYLKIEDLKTDKHDIWHVCCGHDVVHILAIGLRKALGTNASIEPDLIEKLLRIGYEQTDFRQTRLFLAIQLWEKANTPFVVLDPQLTQA